MDPIHRCCMAWVWIGAGIVAAQGDTPVDPPPGRIQPHAANPRYWQYRDKPVLLLGGTKDDNLFQIPDLEEHLDLLASVGGNYIRNTMSSRDPENVQPFEQVEGKYDLDRWNSEYWRRFESMLGLTHRHDIIVQIEVWAFHDFNEGRWEKSPWNPANTISYSAANTTLREQYGNIGRTQHGFFLTVPSLNDDPVVLRYQQRFVEKLLSHSLQYDHVLYCITNEIHPTYSPEWGWHWSGYVREKAAGAGKNVQTAEMYWQPALTHDQHLASLDHPDVFSYFEASQNSAVLDGQQNWDNLQFVQGYLDSNPRPINHVKIHGADEGPWEGVDERQATECFWRNTIGGSASSRFHRPPAGLGLSEKAQTHIKSARMLTADLDIFKCTPDANSSLLRHREPNEAYLTRIDGSQYAVYFPDGGGVELDPAGATGELRLRWLEVGQSRWHPAQRTAGGETVALTPPDPGHWVALIVARQTSRRTCSKAEGNGALARAEERERNVLDWWPHERHEYQEGAELRVARVAGGGLTKWVRPRSPRTEKARDAQTSRVLRTHGGGE